MTRDMVAIVAAAKVRPMSSAGGTDHEANPKGQEPLLLGIGHRGGLPWNLPGDMKHFRDVTTATVDDGSSSSNNNKKNAVVMGRRTWESITPKFRPLKGRINVVLTRSPTPGIVGTDDVDENETVLVANSLKDASEKLTAQFSDDVGTVFVIGGEQVYRDALEGGFVDRVLFTEVSNLPTDGEGKPVKFDAYFPSLDPDEWEVRPYGMVNNGEKERDEGDDKENHSDGCGVQVDANSGISYRFLEYVRKRNVEELQYLDLCRDIMENGIRRGDRTGTGTISKFGAQLRFDLRDGKLPLLTTKRTFWRGVAEELLWFISVRACMLFWFTQYARM